VTESIQLSLPVKRFRLAGKERVYVDLTLPYGQFLKYFRVVPFDAKTGGGHQRSFDPKHAAKLGAEMVAGTYTPTSFGACLKPKQRVNAVIEGGTVNITLDGRPTRFP
jgi:hypothetical protein